MMELAFAWILFGGVFWILFGVVAAIIAGTKGRSGFGWFILGLLFGPFSLVILALPTLDTATNSPTTPDSSPYGQQFNRDRKCPFCAETIKAEAVICRFCNRDLPPIEPSINCTPTEAVLSHTAKTHPKTLESAVTAQVPDGMAGRLAAVLRNRLGTILATIILTIGALEIFSAWFSMRTSDLVRSEDVKQVQDMISKDTEVSSPSFDCSKAQHPGEIIVCSMPQLGYLDQRLSDEYKNAMARSNSEPAAMKKSQIAWIGQRNACQTAQCVSDAYAQRLQVLDAYVGNDIQAVGHCMRDKIKSNGSRFRNDPLSGTSVDYVSGHYGVSYGTIPQVFRSKPNDEVILCLQSVPTGCPPGDDRGKIYSAHNLRTNESWALQDSQHGCGGA